MSEWVVLVPAIIGGALFGWVGGKALNRWRYPPPEPISKEDMLAQADGGDATAQFSVGMAFHLGQSGFERSPTDALKYFRLAAAQDQLQAASREGVGEPDPEAEEKAKVEKTAQARALYCLGIYHLSGDGLEKQDEGAAVEYFTKAADKGLGSAQLQLSQCALDGVGMKADPVRALSLSLSPPPPAPLPASSRAQRLGLGLGAGCGCGVAADGGGQPRAGREHGRDAPPGILPGSRPRR